jgi:hypothetical protein
MIYGNIVITDIDDNNKYDLLECLTPNCKSGYLCKEIQNDTDLDQLMDNMECNPNVVLHIYSEKNPEEVAAVTEQELSKSMGVMFSDKNEDYAVWLGNDDMDYFPDSVKNKFWEDIFPYLLRYSVEK